MPGGGKEDAGRVPTDTCETQREALHIRHLDSDDRLDCWRSVPVGGDGYKDWHSKEIGIINQSPSFFFFFNSQLLVLSEKRKSIEWSRFWRIFSWAVCPTPGSGATGGCWPPPFLELALDDRLLLPRRTLIIYPPIRRSRHSAVCLAFIHTGRPPWELTELIWRLVTVSENKKHTAQEGKKSLVVRAGCSYNYKMCAQSGAATVGPEMHQSVGTTNLYTGRCL